MGVFKNAKKKPETTGKKKEVIRETILLKESKHKGIGEKAERLMKLREQVKSLEAELKMTDSDINDIARKEWLDLYKKKGDNPKMIIAECENGVKFNITPADAYTKVDEEKFNLLTKKYGKEIANCETTYSFNNEVLERNMKTIEKLIDGCKEISQEDKDNLLIQNDKYSIAKGTIDKLLYYGKKGSVDTLFETIRPTVQIKF